MAWYLDSKSGPYPAPWEGKDVVAWVWEIYSDDVRRRVLVEVSGTAMAVDPDLLPTETAEARATSGRSEVEKILELSDPPRRITLGTSGRLEADPSRPTRPDFVLSDDAGTAVAAVEVKNPEDLTLPLASVLRDRIAPLGSNEYRFFLVISQERGFLFDSALNQYQPATEIPMFEVVQSYYPPATPHQRFRGRQLELLVFQWLGDMIDGETPEREAERLLEAAGFTEAIRGAHIKVE